MSNNFRFFIVHFKSYPNYISHIFRIVPTAANLTNATAMNSTTIRVIWFAPPVFEQNGPILSFLIDFSNNIILEPYNQTFLLITIDFPIAVDVQFMMDFTVEEAITYNVTVAGVNSAGIGTASENIQVTTGIAGEQGIIIYISFLIINVNMFTP